MAKINPHNIYNYFLLVAVVVIAVMQLDLPIKVPSLEERQIVSVLDAILLLTTFALNNRDYQDDSIRPMAFWFRIFCLLGAFEEITRSQLNIQVIAMFIPEYLIRVAHNIFGVLVYYALMQMFNRVFWCGWTNVGRILNVLALISILILALGGLSVSSQIYIIAAWNAMAGLGVIILVLCWSILRVKRPPHIYMLIMIFSTLAFIFELTLTIVGINISLWAIPLFFYIMILSLSFRASSIHRELMLDRQREALDLVYKRDQIKPHFVYNALTMIRSLMRRDVEKAAGAIGDFSLLLRGLSEDGDEQGRVSLRKELQVTQSYLKLQKNILSVPLNYLFEIDECLVNLPIPAFCIQTLVENSIKHALQPRKELIIHIKVVLLDDKAIVTVADNGRGMTDTQIATIHNEDATGVGLVNTLRRLRMCGGAMAMNNTVDGFMVTLSVPVKS